MFVLSILVYVSFAVAMSSLAKRSYMYCPSDSKWDDYLKCYIAFYVLICALRWNVGVDSISYARMFENTASLAGKHKELGFNVLTYLSTCLGWHYAVGFAICAFLQIFPITKALKDYKYILITLPLVLFGSRYFQDLNNGVRQMMVASLFIYANRFIVDRTPWHYTAFILIGSTIHQSAYMLVPFYFIPNKLHMANKRLLMLGVFTFCFVAGRTPAFQGAISYVEQLAHLFGYSGYAERATTFLSQGKTDEALAFGPMMLSYLLIAYLIIWFGPHLKERYQERIRYFNLWYNLAFFYACAYFLICNVSHIFIRPVQYFELFQMVIAALLLYELGKMSSRYHQLAYFFFLCVLWVNTAWDVTKNYGKTRESSTYKVFFLHEEEVKKCLNR